MNALPKSTMKAFQRSSKCQGQEDTVPLLITAVYSVNDTCALPGSLLTKSAKAKCLCPCNVNVFENDLDRIFCF